MRTLLAGLLLIPALAWGQSAPPLRPDPNLTPGVVVTIDAAKVCKPGYAKSQRHTPQVVKDTAYGEYGIASHKAGGDPGRLDKSAPSFLTEPAVALGRREGGS